MARVLVTGMSGTGKSTALAELGRRGWRVVDTDSGDWSEWVSLPDDPVGEWLWREDRIAELLSADEDGTLYVSGCASNQGKFYDRFDAIVLLSAPAEVLLERIEHLGQAIDRSERLRSLAAKDSDFDPIRNEPDFKELVGG